MKIKLNKEWWNTIKKFGGTMPYYCYPKNLQDLVALIQRAESENKRIKAVGSGHSFSDIALPECYLVDLKKMNTLLPLNRDSIKEKFNHMNLVHVEGGISVQKFNKRMEQQGLCVKNMGGLDDQTLAGAISTGTHGTGINLPSFPGMVKSIVLATHNGKCLRIEPNDGITNSDKHNEPGIDLIQDDTYFNSALVNLGCFGIIYSFILEMEDMYYLEETKKLYDWSCVKPKLEDRSLFNELDGSPIRGVMVQVNPYKNDEGDHTCIVVRHRLLDKMPARSIGDATRNWISSTLSYFPLSYWYLRRVANKKPFKLPKMLDASLKSLRDKRYINKGYRVLYQGAEYIKKRAYDSEFAFDLSDGKNNFIKALEKMFAKAEENMSKGLYQTAPMGLRFVDRSSAFLSPEYDKQVAYIDTPFIKGTPNLDQQLFTYQEIMLAEEGIPHWGKINTVLDGKPEIIKKYYPKLNEWQDVFNKLNPDKLFSNKFSDRLNLGSI